MTAINVHRAKADELLAKYAEQGTAVLSAARSVADFEEYEAWKLERTRWRKLTAAALAHIYPAQPAIQREFSGVGPMVVQRGTTWTEELKRDCDDVRAAISVLESLKERLEFAEEPSETAGAATPTTTKPAGGGVIFLVHGKNRTAREEVARFLEKAGGHKVVVLDEQANQGRTLIEKFEAHASQANYAVILLTGDDVGGPHVPEGPLRPRARQNVVFELGFFFGSVGRERVAVLYEPDVEKPSDIDGLVYIELDPAGAWKGFIVKELRAAHLDLDANTA